MNNLFDSDKIKQFPAKPGVYLMKNARGKVLYVGKAKNIKLRVKQYFLKGGDGRTSVPLLIKQIVSIDTIVVASEKEALLLENTLIKRFRPKYNVLLKDDKSYIAICINNKHEWPMVQIVRYRGEPRPGALYFGPYTSAMAARQTVDLIHKLFPLRQCSDQELARRTRPCILYGMKRCVAPCVGYCSRKEYDSYLEKAVKFLRGEDKEIISDLYIEMEAQAEALEFEKAADIHKLIKYIERTVEAQHVDVPLGVDCDAFGLYRQGDEVTINQLQFRRGKLLGAANFNFSESAQEDEEIVSSFILQHYHAGSDLPPLILVPMNLVGGEALGEILSGLTNSKTEVLAPKRGDKARLLQMANENAEAAFKKDKDFKAIMENTLLSLKELLRLSRYPKRIECFDNSNLAGEDPVSSMVVFTNGKKDSKRYRVYKVKTASKSDDYGAMFEVLGRRYKRAKEENDLPDLLIIDGGKGHLNVARRVLDELDISNVDIIALTKEEGRHDKGMSGERVFLPDVKDPVIPKINSPVLFFLQRVRDEAHRTAIAFQQKRRSKGLIKSSLDLIEGIGPAKRKELLRHFGSVKAIKEATEEDLSEVKGISQKNAETVHQFFQKH